MQADLNKLKSLSMELANLEEFNPYRNNVITDMPKGGQGKDVTAWYIEEKERLRGKIKTYEEKLRRDRAKVEAFIAAAPHPESEIIRYRVINDLSWSGENVTATLVSRIDQTVKVELRGQYVEDIELKAGMPQTISF